MAFNRNQNGNSSPWLTEAHKKRPVPINPNEELICNNCINDELINAKNRMNRGYNNGESPLDVQDRLNKLAQDNIKSKVQQRIQLSEKLAKNMGRLRSADKERFINGNEKGTFFLDDPNLLSNDISKKRALERYNQNQLTGGRLNQSALANRDVDEYYKNCVE